MVIVQNRRQLYFNPRAFRGRYVTTAAGQIVSDIYWYGNAPRYTDGLRGSGHHYGRPNLLLYSGELIKALTIWADLKSPKLLSLLSQNA